MEKIVILGNGGHAGSLVDIVERENKYKIAGYVINEADQLMEKSDYPIIGSDEDLERIFQSGIKNAAIGIGYLGKTTLRERLWYKLKRIGFFCPVICDPSAVLANRINIGEGSMIGKRAVINSNVSIGRMCIINTGAIIEHDCVVEDFSHISVGSTLCGNVQVGKATFVGANATVIQGKDIGNRCIVGAGTTIRKNVKDDGIVWSGVKVEQD